MNAAEIAAVLGDAKRNGRGWLAKCPLHQDATASLSIRDGDLVAILVKCFAECDSRDVLIELRRRGFLPDEERERRHKQKEPPPVPPSEDEPLSQSRIDSVLE